VEESKKLRKAAWKLGGRRDLIAVGERRSG
jgi:hypothetical protein